MASNSPNDKGFKAESGSLRTKGKKLQLFQTGNQLEIAKSHNSRYGECDYQAYRVTTTVWREARFRQGKLQTMWAKEQVQ